MTTKYFAILTNQGAARLANATALGTKLNITQMAVGDGGGTLPTPDPAQTKLVNQTRIAPINSLGVDANDAGQIIAEQIIPENEGGFFIREIGLYDDDGVLIAVANCPETYKPLLAEGSGRTQTIRMILVVSSTSAITLKIDPSVVLATRKYVDDAVIEVKGYADKLMKDHEAKANPHKQYPLIENALKEMADAGLIDKVLENLGLGDDNGYVGRKIAEQWITSSKLLTLNPRTEYFKVVITGAGGGAGGAFNGGGSNDNFSGGGGAAGGTGIKWFRVADVTNWAVVIGSGGTEATKGGDSSFSGIVAPGGAPAVASTVFAAGGTGGAGTGADINLAGGDGGDGQNGAFLLSGFGGASYWGGSRRAGQGQSGSTTIPKARVPGAGGGGAFDTQKMGVRFYGGQGADGICFIEEYA